MMKTDKLFRLSPLFLSLAAAWQPVFAGEVQDVCEDANEGCFYVYHANKDANTEYRWIRTDKERYPYDDSSSGKNKVLSDWEDPKVSHTRLSVVLKPQHYQNTPATIDPNENQAYNLIGIKLSHPEHSSSLLIPKGATLSLSQARPGSNLLNLSNTHAVIERGAQLNFLSSNIRDDEQDSFGNIIHIYGKNARLDTAADMNIQTEGAAAIEAGGHAQIKAHDLKVTLGKAYNLAFDIDDSASLTADNVEISGNSEWQRAFEVREATQVNVNNSKVALNHDETSAVYITENGHINITDSTFEAGIGIYSEEEPEGPNSVRISNSTVRGRRALIGIEVPESSPSGTNITAENNSRLFGSVKPFYNTGAGKVSMTLDNSFWEFDDNSTVNALSLNNSETASKAKPDGSFSVLTTDTLSGSGTFALNTDLAKEQSDKIVVKTKDEGSFLLKINDSGNEPNTANGKVTLVETPSGTAVFALKDKDFVDAGAYRYRLVKDGGNWLLSNRSGEQGKPDNPITPKPPVQPTPPVNPQPPVQPNPPVTPQPPAQPNPPVTPTPVPPQPPVTPPAVPNPPAGQLALSETTNALISLRQAQLLAGEQDLSGLHQRLGELKNGGNGSVWVRNTNSRNRFERNRAAGNAHASGFKQTANSLQIGTDTALSDNLKLGGFIGSSRSDVDFAGEYGSGTVSSLHGGAYGTYLADNGFYADTLIRYGRLKSRSPSVGTSRHHAYTLSGKVGLIRALGEGWTVTPQLQAAWTRLSGSARESGLSAWTTRIGTRAAKDVKLQQWTVQPYAELNWLHSRNSDATVRVNQYRFDVASAGTRIQAALGVNAQNGGHRFGLEAAAAKGRRTAQNIRVQAVYRHSW